MNNVVRIEYCTSWGYLGRAVALTRKLLNEHKNSIGKVEIIPSSGGVFEVSFRDNLIFSKKELNRYPEKDEIEEIIKRNLD